MTADQGQKDQGQGHKVMQCISSKNVITIATDGRINLNFKLLGNLHCGGAKHRHTF